MQITDRKTKVHILIQLYWIQDRRAGAKIAFNCIDSTTQTGTNTDAMRFSSDTSQVILFSLEYPAIAFIIESGPQQ